MAWLTRIWNDYFTSNNFSQTEGYSSMTMGMLGEYIVMFKGRNRKFAFGSEMRRWDYYLV